MIITLGSGNKKAPPTFSYEAGKEIFADATDVSIEIPRKGNSATVHYTRNGHRIAITAPLSQMIKGGWIKRVEVPQEVVVTKAYKILVDGTVIFPPGEYEKHIQDMAFRFAAQAFEKRVKKEHGCGHKVTFWITNQTGQRRICKTCGKDITPLLLVTQA